jgi:hypothetical protein
MACKPAYIHSLQLQTHTRQIRRAVPHLPMQHRRGQPVRLLISVRHAYHALTRLACQQCEWCSAERACVCVCEGPIDQTSQKSRGRDESDCASARRGKALATTTTIRAPRCVHLQTPGTVANAAGHATFAHLSQAVSTAIINPTVTWSEVGGAGNARNSKSREKKNGKAQKKVVME